MKTLVIEQPNLASLAIPTGDAEVHVWVIDVNLIASADIESLKSVLNEQEQERVERYVFAHDRHLHLCARGMQKTILAAYVNASAASLQFERSDGGKPRLANGTGKSALYFNISHAKDKIALAVSRKLDVGVDIEVIQDRQHDHQQIAQRFFSEQEATALQQLASEDQRQAFYKAWTVKEAVLKCLGVGLAMELNAFTIDVELTTLKQSLTVKQQQIDIETYQRNDGWLSVATRKPLL